MQIIFLLRKCKSHKFEWVIKQWICNLIEIVYWDKKTISQIPMNANFLQKLTGKTAEDIETEMGYPSTRDGGGVPIQVPKIFHCKFYR